MEVIYNGNYQNNGKFTERFRDNDILIENIKQFHYSTEEEKMEHKASMEADGYKDSGQVKENIGTIMQPEHVWFGNYYKYEIEK